MTKREASKHDRRQALLDAQRETRDSDPRPSEEILREMRDEWSSHGEKVIEGETK